LFCFTIFEISSNAIVKRTTERDDPWEIPFCILKVYGVAIVCRDSECTAIEERFYEI